MNAKTAKLINRVASAVLRRELRRTPRMPPAQQHQVRSYERSRIKRQWLQTPWSQRRVLRARLKLSLLKEAAK